MIKQFLVSEISVPDTYQQMPLSHSNAARVLLLPFLHLTLGIAFKILCLCISHSRERRNGREILMADF